jgi:hypothetical protein
MSPFKGQGANQAIIDGVALARALYQCSTGFETDAVGIRRGAAAPRYAVPGGGPSMHQRYDVVTQASGTPELPLSQALQDFEEGMLSRSTVKAKCSNDAVKILHSKGADSVR